jgi:energy-converting hydrogenase Eha subunit A
MGRNNRPLIQKETSIRTSLDKARPFPYPIVNQIKSIQVKAQAVVLNTFLAETIL